MSCVHGLANRLRVLVSGLAVAEAAGRSFAMHWPRTPHCGAAFRELFTNDWPVLDLEAPDPSLKRYVVHPWPANAGHQLLADPRPHVIVSTYTWLIGPGDEVAPCVGRRSVALLAELDPHPALSERVTAFKRSHFRPTMIGVHLRRGDFLRMRPHLAGNTGKAMAVVDRLMAETPEAGIFLSSDDGARDAALGRDTNPEGVRADFTSRYGTRVVSVEPRSLDRRNIAAIRDAVVDLWLLRQTDAVIGTASSSFSELAVAGRDVPHMFVGGAVPAYRPFAFLAHVPKVHGLALRAYRLASRLRL